MAFIKAMLRSFSGLSDQEKKKILAWPRFEADYLDKRFFDNAQKDDQKNKETYEPLYKTQRLSPDKFNVLSTEIERLGPKLGLAIVTDANEFTFVTDKKSYDILQEKLAQFREDINKTQQYSGRS